MLNHMCTKHCQILNIMLGQGLSNLATVESVGNDTIPMPDFNLTNLGWSPSIGDF